MVSFHNCSFIVNISASPSHTTLSMSPFCRGTGLRKITGHFLKMYAQHLKGIPNAGQSLFWCCGPIPAVYWEQSRRHLFRNHHSFKDHHHHTMTKAEATMYLSTLKTVKTFLRNIMTQERLNAFAMPSMEKGLVCEMYCMWEFAGQMERRAKFILNMHFINY